MGIRDEFARFIEDEGELDDFGEWAFGENFRELDHSLKFMEAWNLRHGETLQLLPDSCIQQDVPKMIQLWKDSLA